MENRPRDWSELRQRAERVLHVRDGDPPPALADVQHLVHELEVHRVELQMQNAELREAQQALEESRDRYADLYDFAPLGYVTLDEHAVIREINLRGAAMLGAPRRALEGRGLTSFLATADKKAFLERFYRCRESGEEVGMEVELPRRRQRATLCAQLKLVRAEARGDGPPHVRVAMTDVTDLHEATRQARQASEAKSRFLANVSHEIRTPMASILGYAELLEEPRLEEDERRHYLAVIRRNGQALLDLINDVLDISRIEAGRLPVRFEPCDPAAVAQEVAATFQKEADEKRLALEVEGLQALPPRVQTDPARLRQILVNLLGNALKYTDAGSIRLACGADELAADAVRLWFRVADTGIGIAEDKLGSIFEPLTQVDESHTRRHGGAGLGLAISQRLAELLGGYIDVESAPGQGSTFTLYLDVERAAAAAEPARAESKPGDGEWPLQGRVLVVDDARELRHLVRKILEPAGAEVDEAEDGHVGTRKALLPEKKPYDAILMDIQMPGMDGFEATRRLRQGGWSGPVIALTAHAMAGDRQRCLEAGCDDYLAKPISRRELLSVVGRYLKSS